MRTRPWIDYQDQHHRPGYVYLVHQVGTDRYKIGLTSNPEKRLKQLQTGSSDRLKFAHIIECLDMSLTEKGLHQLYARHRIRSDGEWFTFANHEIGGVIEAMNDSQRIASDKPVKGVWSRSNLALAVLVAAVCLILLWWDGVSHQRQIKPYHVKPISSHPVTGSQKF